MMGLDREYRSDDGGRSHLRGIKVGCTVAVGGAEEAIATVLNTCDQDILGNGGFFVQGEFGHNCICTAY